MFSSEKCSRRIMFLVHDVLRWKMFFGEQYSLVKKALVDYVLDNTSGSRCSLMTNVLYGTMFSGEQSSMINNFVKQWFILVYSVLWWSLVNSLSLKNSILEYVVSTVQFRRALVCIPTGGFQMGNSPVSWRIKTFKNTNSSDKSRVYFSTRKN